MPVPFAQVRTIDGLAANLGCTIGDLAEFTDAADQSSFYTALRLPKKGKRRGEVRVVYAAHQRLALVQKNLATWIAGYVEFPEYVQGFVHRRSISSNARFHLGQKYALHTDITDFFDTIGRVVCQVVCHLNRRRLRPDDFPGDFGEPKFRQLEPARPVASTS